MTLKEKFENEKKCLLAEIKILDAVTDYNAAYELIGIDKSLHYPADKIKGYIYEAEKVFIETHKREVLKLAAEMVRNSIGE